MAGHSKWANIKHRKAAQDAKRGKVFTKLIRELVVAAKIGGPLPEDNPRLRAAVDKALSANMTRDTIDRAIKRGAGSDNDENMEEITYEGYASGGIAVLVNCLTDNRNRTVSEVRHAFSKHGGNLGTDGSVSYLFTKKGQLIFEGYQAKEDALMETALESGAEDINTLEDGNIEVFTDWTELFSVKELMEKSGFKTQNAETCMIPSTHVTLDNDGATKLIKFVDFLEDLDDVQNVFTNADIPDEVLSEMN